MEQLKVRREAQEAKRQAEEAKQEAEAGSGKTTEDTTEHRDGEPKEGKVKLFSDSELLDLLSSVLTFDSFIHISRFSCLCFSDSKKI